MNNYPLLSLINSPEDLRLLNKEQLPQLCQELRSYLLESVSQFADCIQEIGINFDLMDSDIASKIG